MGKYKYTLITSAILSCFLIGCGGGGSSTTKPASENSNAEAPAQQTEPATPEESSTPDDTSTPEEPAAADEPEETEEMPQSGKLTVQSIDGYLVQVKTCIVKDEDPALPCDEDFIDSRTGEPAIGTDATGKVKFELSAEQLQKLKQKG